MGEGGRRDRQQRWRWGGAVLGVATALVVAVIGTVSPAGWGPAGRRAPAPAAPAGSPSPGLGVAAALHRVGAEPALVRPQGGAMPRRGETPWLAPGSDGAGPPWRREPAQPRVRPVVWEHVAPGAATPAGWARVVTLLRVRGVLRAVEGPPGRPVTRAEVAGWLVRGLVRPAPPLGQPAAEAMALAGGLGWLPPEWRGADGGFQPDAAVRRQDLARIAAAVLGAARGRWPAGRPQPPDLAALPPAEQAVARAALANGLLPLRAGRWDGERPATLLEALAWCARLMELQGVLFDEEGVVVAVHPDSGRVVVQRAGEDLILEVPPRTPVYRNDAAVALAELRPGDEIRWVWAAPGDSGGAAPGGSPGGDATGRDAGARTTGGQAGAGTLAGGPGRAGFPAVAVLDASLVAWSGALAAVDWPGARIRVAARAGQPRWPPAQPARGPGDPLAGIPAGAAAIDLAVERGAAIFLNGRPASLADLQPSDRVTVVLRRSTGAVRWLDAVRVDVTGLLEGVDPLHGVLTVRTGSGPAAWVVGDDAVLVRQGRPVSLEEFRPGDRVLLARAAPGVAGYVEAAAGAAVVPGEGGP